MPFLNEYWTNHVIFGCHDYFNCNNCERRMDLSLTRRRLNREITGPTPHSVAIRAKPSPRLPKEHLILETRKQDRLREEANAIVNYTKHFDLRTTWERETSKKLHKNNIKRKVESLLQQQRYSLEERRDRLRELLQAEEEQYISEIATKQETPLERQAKMRERAKFLRDQRETERLTLVEEKLEQRWRDQCEEMRSLLSKKHRDKVFSERASQLRLNEQKREREKQEERMFAQMWQADIETKSKREEMEEALKIEKNRQMLKVLTLQSAAIEKQKEELHKLKDLESQHLREEAALRALEEQRTKEEKKRAQEQMRAELNLSLRLKMKRKAREAQEELAMDMRILEQMLQQSNDETNEQEQRKRELRNEMRHYREYLSEQKKEEQAREKELDAILTAQVEKQWNQRVAQWKKEKEARKNLMHNVMETRQKQIKEKLEAIAERRKELEREAEQVSANIAAHKEMEAEEQRRMKERNLLHQQHLLEQVHYQEMVREHEREEQLEELKMAEREEHLHQLRVQHAVLNPDLKNTHPRKLLAMGQYD